jgi:Flp pilus assembly protein TadG
MLSNLSGLRNVCTRFVRNESGNAIILVAGAMVVMVIAVGVAIDLSREQTLQSRMANAADAAALASGVAVANSIQTGGACVSDISDAAKLSTCEGTVAQDAANKYYNANFPSQYLQSGAFTPVVTVDANAGTITLTANTTQKTDFLSTLGVSSVPLNVYCQVKLPAGICGPSNGVPTATAPTASSLVANVSLCATGNTASAVTGNGTSQNWSWSCTPGTGGIAASCSAPLKGGCEGLNATATAPNGTLCTSGTPSVTTASGDWHTQAWSWSCNGSPNNTADNLACSTNLLGKCNTAVTGSSTAPSGATLLCSAGVPVNASGQAITTAVSLSPVNSNPAGITVPAGPWTWACDGTGGSNDNPCYSPLNGQVGTAENVPASTAPANTAAAPNVLCAVGTASAVTIDPTNGEWTWTCAGSPGEVVDGVTIPAGTPASGAAPLNGSCSTTPNTCITGTFANASASNGQDTWNCDGSQAATVGGVSISAGTTASCSITTPVNGACNNTGANLCTTTYGYENSSTSNGVTTWYCKGTNGGSDSTQCKYTASCPTGSYGTPGNCSTTIENINFYVRPYKGYFGFAVSSAGCNNGTCPDYWGPSGSYDTTNDYEDVSGTKFTYTTSPSDQGMACASTVSYYNPLTTFTTTECINPYVESAATLIANSNGTLTNAIILADYLTTPAGKADPAATQCGLSCVNFVPNILISPLKVNINGGNAVLNSDRPMTFSLSHRKGGTTLHHTTGSLNPGEAWLMIDRRGNGLVHDGVVDGDDLFTDHDGAKKDAYEDLATTFASSLKKDEYGRTYIPLHVIEKKKRAKEQQAHEARADKRAGKERELDPSIDLKLLDSNNNVLLASDYFDRIYVDHKNVAVSDAAAKNYILATSIVRDLHGELHQSVDQWFNTATH